MAKAAFAPNLNGVLEDLAASRHYNAWLFERARPHLGTRVLDVGAGIGTFSELAARAGADVTALEPEPEFAEYLRERFADRADVAVVEGEATSRAAELAMRFDSVLCLNVLEHVPDDALALKRMLETLVPGGRLLLLVPAHPGLLGGFDRAVGHLRRYRRRSLEQLLTDSGYEVAIVRHVNPIGALGWFLRVRLGRRDHWPSGSFRAFDRLVPALKALDRLRLPFGLSLWAVARRPEAG